MHYLALQVDGYGQVTAPTGIRTGGLAKLSELIQGGVTIFLVFLIIVVLFYMLWGAIQWIISGGDKAKIQAARNRIVYAVIGLVIALLAFVIVQIIGNVFNLNLLNVMTKGPAGTTARPTGTVTCNPHGDAICVPTPTPNPCDNPEFGHCITPTPEKGPGGIF